jgi:pimeloyl-ACP methyl ester carboxylesterase
LSGYPAIKPASFPFRITNPSSKGEVVLVHGLGDGPYIMAQLAERFHRLGYSVTAIALTDHGVNRNLRDLGSNDQWEGDVRSAIKKAAGRTDTPVTVVGFSTGGTLATWAAQTMPNSVKDLILLDPALELSASAARFGPRLQVLIERGFPLVRKTVELGLDSWNKGDASDPSRGSVWPTQLTALLKLSDKVRRGKTIGHRSLTILSDDDHYIDSKKTEGSVQRIAPQGTVSNLNLGHERPGARHRALPIAKHFGGNCGLWDVTAVNPRFDAMLHRIEEFMSPQTEDKGPTLRIRSNTSGTAN